MPARRFTVEKIARGSEEGGKRKKEELKKAMAEVISEFLSENSEEIKKRAVSKLIVKNIQLKE